MTKRGVVIVSVMLGLFVLSFGVMGVRALTLGPDAPTPSANEVATRQQAADALERSIATARADVPPALPAVPARVVAEVPAAAATASPASTARSAAPAYEGEEYDDEAYEDDEDEYESEHGDEDEGEYEEGGHDDD